MPKVINLPDGSRKPSNALRLSYIADDFDAPWALVPESELCRKKKGKRR
jgi:hypothetical protein